MANEDEPKSPENPLEEMAKSIGSTLGTAANRASEMLRDVMPAALSEKLGVGAAPAKRTATSKSQSKPRKAASAKKAKGSAKKSAPQKSAAGKKSKPVRPAAKKATRSAKKKSAWKSR